MNTTFTKQAEMQTPVSGHMAIVKRCTRRFGIVGTDS
jgi:hypothetical protein